MMYTTRQVAAKLNLSPRTVQKWCGVLGFPLLGGNYVLDDEQVKRIAAAAHDRPGRPKKEERDE